MVDLKQIAHIIRLSLLFTLSNFHFLSFIFVNFEQLSLIVLVPLLLLTKKLRRLFRVYCLLTLNRPHILLIVSVVGYEKI